MSMRLRKFLIQVTYNRSKDTPEQRPDVDLLELRASLYNSVPSFSMRLRMGCIFELALRNLMNVYPCNALQLLELVSV